MTEYNNLNRFQLFATNARGDKAPSHSGKITVTGDMLEYQADGTFVIALTGWMHEKGHLFGTADKYSEKQAKKPFQQVTESGLTPLVRKV